MVTLCPGVASTGWLTCGALWCVSNMAGSLSSSMEGTGFSDSDMSADESTSSVAHREKNLMSLLKQENRVLKMELETCKLRCKQLQEENRALRQASVSIVSWFLNLSFAKQIRELKFMALTPLSRHVIGSLAVAIFSQIRTSMSGLLILYWVHVNNVYLQHQKTLQVVIDKVLCSCYRLYMRKAYIITSR